MEKVVISRLGLKDIKQASLLIEQLHNQIIQKRKDIFISNENDWEAYLRSKLQNNDYVLLKADINDEVVGVCICEIKHCGDGVETKVRDILFIEYIVVNEKYRRCKIGTKLLDEIKQIAKENKISTVELNVWGFNNDAINFYNNNQMKQKRIIYEYLIDKGG